MRVRVQACISQLLAALLTWSAPVVAAELFESDRVIDIHLAGPFGTLFEHIDEKTYRTFTVKSGTGEDPVEIRLRGHSRLRVCAFPPLRLRFPGGPPVDGPFAGLEAVKLVTHCRNSDRGEQDLLEEYVAYRILNVITDLSYRVRLLRMHYHDDSLPADARIRYAFAIEPAESFAERTGTQVATRDAFPRYRHDASHAALMYVYQYLIGNTDWMLLKSDQDEHCCHNSVLYESPGGLIFVPYDFDLVGLVNARYAYPDPQLRINRVTERLYRGLCTDRETLLAALQAVRSKREAITSTVVGVPGLRPGNAERAGRYLQAFFDDAEDTDRMLGRFERQCIQRY